MPAMARPVTTAAEPIQCAERACFALLALVGKAAGALGRASTIAARARRGINWAEQARGRAGARAGALSYHNEINRCNELMTMCLLGLVGWRPEHPLLAPPFATSSIRKLGRRIPSSLWNSLTMLRA